MVGVCEVDGSGFGGLGKGCPESGQKGSKTMISSLQDSLQDSLA